MTDKVELELKIHEIVEGFVNFDVKGLICKCVCFLVKYLFVL